MSWLTQQWNWLSATCCGFGYSPIMPGTAGALWGVAFYAAIAGCFAEPWQSLLLILALLLSCAETVRLGGWAERYFAKKDSSHFVTDEVAGFLLTVLLFRTPHVLATILWAFPVTRLIDIVKVPPARRLERLPRGWGVLADDLLGSLYAAVLLHAGRWCFPHWFA